MDRCKKQTTVNNDAQEINAYRRGAFRSLGAYWRRRLCPHEPDFDATPLMSKRSQGELTLQF